MKEYLILNEPFASVRYVYELRMIHIEWKGVLTKDHYEFAYSKAKGFVDSNNLPIDTFLSDIRNSTVSQEVRNWLLSYGILQLAKRGLCRIAVVFDGSVFKKYYLNILMHSTRKFKIPFMFFRSQDEAYNWIHSFTNQTKKQQIFSVSELFDK